jgi:hypothetical protein
MYHLWRISQQQDFHHAIPKNHLLHKLSFNDGILIDIATYMH